LESFEYPIKDKRKKKLFCGRQKEFISKKVEKFVDGKYKQQNK
jgi:hypothetical protein